MTEKDILFEIEMDDIICRPKKNNMKPIQRGGRTYLVQNERYQNFSDLFDLEIIKQKDRIPKEPINDRCNVQMIITRGDKRRTDLVNNENAILDKLVDNKILKDDNYNIVCSMDGSTMRYEKNVNKIYIKITKK